MKRLLMLAAVLLASTAAHADQWFYVNIDNGPGGSPAGCVAVPQGQDPAGSLRAVLGPVPIQTDTDMTLPDGSRVVILALEGQRYGYASTLKTCTALRAEVLRQNVAAEAGRDTWYVAQYRGDCVALSAMFKGMTTPQALHRAMTRNGSHLSLERRGADVALLHDGFGQYPPLIMVHGLARCQASSAALVAAQ